MRHVRRPELTGREPVHVTLRIADDVLRLRSRRCFTVICRALAATCDRAGFRVNGVTVLGNHLHLLLEVADARALALGMRALTVRLARGLNRLIGRKGPVFPDRYFVHVLRTPTEVLHAQKYVFGNHASHAARNGRPLPDGYRDPYRVGYFGAEVVLPADGPRIVVPPETWLQTEGWRRARIRRKAGAAPVSKGVRASRGRRGSAG